MVRGDVVRLAGRCVTTANGMLRLCPAAIAPRDVADPRWSLLFCEKQPLMHFAFYQPLPSADRKLSAEAPDQLRAPKRVSACKAAYSENDHRRRLQCVLTRSIGRCDDSAGCSQRSQTLVRCPHWSKREITSNMVQWMSKHYTEGHTDADVFAARFQRHKDSRGRWVYATMKFIHRIS